jgi:hypothetical protein
VDEGSFVAADPPLPIRAQHGGAGWRETYRSLSEQERVRVIVKMVLGFARYDAKRRGEPLPIPYTFEPQSIPGGGATAGSMRPMTTEEILDLIPNWFA